MNIFSFKGRINRKQYWCVYLTSSIITGIILLLIGLATGFDDDVVTGAFFVLLIPLLWINLAAYVKRCHDFGGGWWYIFLFAIPFLGYFAWLIIGLVKGDEVDNEYGEAL